MDVIKFVNSKELAEQLKKSNHEFSPEEAIYLIREAENFSVDEKHEAYRELMSLYPDHILKTRKRHIFEGVSLASFLLGYIVSEQHLIAECLSDSDGAYFCAEFYNAKSGWEADEERFATYQECIDAFYNSLKFLKGVGVTAWGDEDKAKLKIHKKFSASSRILTVEVTTDGTIFKVYDSEQNDEYLKTFDWLEINIPVAE